jgi:hypothetical protein
VKPGPRPADAGGSSPSPTRLILDIDATLVTAHSEKKGAAGTYKGGFGFHPLLCFEAASREALSGVLRRGNAGSNTVSDHIEVLARALLQLPQSWHPGTLRLGPSHARLHQRRAQDRLSFLLGFALTEPLRSPVLAVPEPA